MVAVNLLPWRERQLRRQRRCWFQLIFFTLLLLLIALLLVRWQNARAYLQLEREQAELTEQARRLEDALAEQRAAQQKLEQLENLLRQRRRAVDQLNGWHQFWLTLPALLPDSLWLTRLEKRDALLTLEGRSYSMQAVRDFRLQLAAQPLFSQVRQGSVSRQPEGDYYFALRASLQEAQ
ncbi:PilN domain-containing protein [Pantoea osteomyelitidis]|uniref:PilN domain-containing protein n=1 Tax=Pantoea osteomyelitidis TaxID=3230026 RepID=A0ABW7PZW0_9GAMM